MTNSITRDSCCESLAFQVHHYSLKGSNVCMKNRNLQKVRIGINSWEDKTPPPSVSMTRPYGFSTARTCSRTPARAHVLSNNSLQ